MGTAGSSTCKLHYIYSIQKLAVQLPRCTQLPHMEEREREREEERERKRGAEE